MKYFTRCVGLTEHDSARIAAAGVLASLVACGTDPGSAGQFGSGITGGANTGGATDGAGEGTDPGNGSDSSASTTASDSGPGTEATGNDSGEKFDVGSPGTATGGDPSQGDCVDVLDGIYLELR